MLPAALSRSLSRCSHVLPSIQNARFLQRLSQGLLQCINMATYSVEERGSMYSMDYRLYHSKCQLPGVWKGTFHHCWPFIRMWKPVRIAISWHTTRSKRWDDSAEYGGWDTSMDQCKDGGAYVYYIRWFSDWLFSVCRSALENSSTLSSRTSRRAMFVL